MNTPNDPWFSAPEEPASAAHVRDLSAQVQALQAQVTELQRQVRRPRRSPQSLLGITALPACLLAAALAVGISHQAERAVAPAVPAAAAASVHVCADQDFDPSTAACVQDAPVLSALGINDAHLSYTGINGSAFANNQLTVTLSRQNADGTISVLGSFPVDAPYNSTDQALRLEYVFDQANAMAVPGESYVIEVDEGNSSLGTAHFDITI